MACRKGIILCVTLSILCQVYLCFALTGTVIEPTRIIPITVLLTVALFFLFSFRKGPSQNNVMIKELQEAVKQQAQIIDDQAKQHKEEIENLNTISQLPWYKQLQDGQNLTTHSITTHVRMCLTTLSRTEGFLF